ncbi:MAG: hypothetical protein RLZZ292_2047 [Bacteroidota bacterium]|jgi:DNA-binding LytR/AlgR family response regulator
MQPITEYDYLVVDNEEEWRNAVIKCVDDFNKDEQIQNSFEAVFKTRIHLKLLRSRNGKNEDYGLMKDINEAHIVFLDLRFGNVDMGIDFLENTNPSAIKKFIILTGYQKRYSQKEEVYNRALAWLEKPISLGKLVPAIDKFHIAKQEISSVYRAEGIEIKRKGNLLKIPYKDIVCVSTGGGDVKLYLDQDKYSEADRIKDFSANLLSLKSFVDNAFYRNIHRVNSGFAINLSYPWRVKPSRFAYLPKFHGMNDLTQEDFSIKPGYEDTYKLLDNNTKKEKIIRALKNDRLIEEIADDFDVSEEYVLKIQNELKDDK